MNGCETARKNFRKNRFDSNPVAPTIFLSSIHVVVMFAGSNAGGSNFSM